MLAAPASKIKKDDKKVEVILDDSEYLKIRDALKADLAYFVARSQDTADMPN